MYTLNYSVYEIQTYEYLITWLASARLHEHCLSFAVHERCFMVRANGH